MGSATTPTTTRPRSFTITDRPVYRPDQTVKYKFWVGYAKYDLPDTSAFAGRSFTVEIHNPKGEKVVSREQEGRRLRRVRRPVQAAGRRHAGRLQHDGQARQGNN